MKLFFVINVHQEYVFIYVHTYTYSHSHTHNHFNTLYVNENLV